MSQTLGRMLICDRCGVTVFEPVRKAEGDEVWVNDTLYFVETNGWVEPRYYDLKYGKHNEHTSLCPDCEAERKDVMKQFWNSKQVLKGKFHWLWGYNLLFC